MENMRAGYEDVYNMPYGRRQRLVKWKQERIQEENDRQQASIAKMSSRRR